MKRGAWLWWCLLAACATEPDPSSGQPMAAQHVGPVTAVVRLGDLVLSCSQAGVLRDSDGGLSTWWQPGFRVLALAAGSGPAPMLLAGGGDPGTRGLLAVLDAQGQVCARADVATDLAYAVAMRPDGARGAAALADGRVLEFALPALTGPALVHAHTAPARAVAWSPDGRWLASAGLDRVVLLRATAAGTTRALLDHTSGVECLAWSAAGDVLASGARDGKVRCHDTSGRLLRTCAGLGAPVVALIWHPGARAFCAGLADGRVVQLSHDDAGHHPVAASAPWVGRHAPALLAPR